MSIKVTYLDHRRVNMTKTFSSVESLCNDLWAVILRSRITRGVQDNLTAARRVEMLTEEKRLEGILKRYDPAGKYSPKKNAAPKGKTARAITKPLSEANRKMLNDFIARRSKHGIETADFCSFDYEVS